MSDRWLCIHGHFYQPPRENAWLEEIEVQDSAYPYHDWNRRITAECYAPNARARILDDEERITAIVNNYERISFNFGPTLLEWLERRAPRTYRAVLDADRASATRFAGHGSALAQGYNHAILPLCNERDRRTQLIWGLRDFERRFGRKAEGLWLPETACDTPTLKALAELGVRFTVLAPSQARSIRRDGTRTWTDVGGGRIDPRRAYRANLPGGRSLALFFYDGAISRAVAFEHLLGRGERFLERLRGGFRADETGPQLVHIATDGETYGHHHRFGDMALAWALERLDADADVRLTNYGEFLERFPPQHEVRIVEGSAWSCAHGLGRWREDCGCQSGGHPDWHQRWRAPLRAALDALRDTLGEHFERAGGRLLKDPWAARDAFIDVVLDRAPERIDDFLREHARAALGESARVQALQLLEMQRHAMLMYTSCGWFFDEVSGIETIQVLQYASRAAELAERTGATRIESSLVERLARAPSNLPEYGDAARLYDKRVTPARFDLAKIAANVAAAALFRCDEASMAHRAYDTRSAEHQIVEAGKTRLMIGRLAIASRLTAARRELVYGFLHLGEHNFTGGIRGFVDEPGYRRLEREAGEAFAAADLPTTLRRLASHLGELDLSMQSLGRDLQREIVERLVGDSVTDAESEHEALYERHAALMRFLTSIETPLPQVLRATATVVLNGRLRRALAADPIDVAALRRVLDEVARAGVELDADGLAYAAREALEGRIERLSDGPPALGELGALLELTRTVRGLPFPVDLARAEERFFDLTRGPLAPALVVEATARPLRELASAMRVALEG